jgi:sugar/nucleoside kinase (ribokinase family)
MSTRSGILSGGNWIVDKLKVIDTYPQQDALANILSQSTGNGGSPFNVLVNLARLGAPFPLAGIGLVGDDADGQWIMRQCKEYGIDSSQLRIHPDAATSYTDVMTVQSSGRRTFFHQRGANAFLEPGHFDFTANPGKLFHLGYLLLLDGLDRADPEFGTAAARVLHQARKAGFKTSVDLVSEDSQRFADIVLPTLPQVDYCILNEFELERTAGLQTRRDGAVDLQAIRAAARKLLEAGVRESVIVHFPEGACALGGNGVFTVRGSIRIPASQIVSTVGAGDAFAAGLLMGIHGDAAMETSIQYGIAAAASCLLGVGTSDGICSKEECLGLEKRFGTRPLV